MGIRLVDVVNSQYRIGITVEVDEDEKTGQFKFLSVKNVRTENFHNLGPTAQLQAMTLYALIWDTYLHLRKKIELDDTEINELRVKIAKPFVLETEIDKLEDKLRASYPKVELVLPEEVSDRMVLLVAPGEVKDQLEPLSGVFARQRAAMIADCARAQHAKEQAKVEKHKDLLWSWREKNIKASGDLLNLYCAMANVPAEKVVFDRNWVRDAL